MVTEISISVRSLVEFLLRSGDLDNTSGVGGEEAMQEGSRMHRQIQKAAGEGYQAEVSLKIRWNFQKRLSGTTNGATAELGDSEHVDSSARPFLDEATVIVEGRADGLYFGAVPERDLRGPSKRSKGKKQNEEPESVWTIDEIKTTYRRLNRIRKPEPVHLAQAKCYAYIYAVQNDLKRINVRMTYCNLFSGEIKYFYEEYTLEELDEWFSSLMEEYRKWAEYSFMWQLKRTATIRELPFPYPYRPGQKDLAAAVYRTVARGKKLFLEAPTGTGKTITTLYPSVKAMGEGKAQKIFYLTAKTITRQAAESAVSEMRGKGLLLKSVVLTAKDKICVLEKPACNPKDCPRAKGHYDRVNEALFDLLTHEDAYSRETIERYAAKYNVCPFEMGLDITWFSDAIIGDYNYLFHPHAFLRRFFGEDGGRKGDYIFLVDEAHNLVDRGRDMYSAEIVKEDVLELKKQIHGIYDGLEKKLNKCNRDLLAIKKLTEGLTKLPDIDSCIDGIYLVQGEIADILTSEKILEQNGQFAHDPLRKEKLAVRDALLDFYFNINHFLLMFEGLDDHYVIYSEIMEDDRFRVKLFCVDPSAMLRKCEERGVSSILFSATLLPIQYYKSLLGGTKEDFEVYARSVFDPAKQQLLIINNLTSAYKKRSPEQYERIADCIHDLTGERHGNYMIFFPSYSFMKQVADIFEVKYLGRDPSEFKDLPVPAGIKRSPFFQEAFEFDGEGMLVQTGEMDGGSRMGGIYGGSTLPAPVHDGMVPGMEITLIRQRANMDELHREAFLKMFERVSDSESLLGFCVLGGIFSEGIDLRSDSLIGAIVVGTGLPQVSKERDLLKDYFNAHGDNGYDYAYRFPGMNKVLQAAGRVIRTQEDVGFVALVDERFTTRPYQKLFPEEWSHHTEVSAFEAPALIEKFWNEWL